MIKHYSVISEHNTFNFCNPKYFAHSLFFWSITVIWRCLKMKELQRQAHNLCGRAVGIIINEMLPFQKFQNVVKHSWTKAHELVSRCQLVLESLFCDSARVVCDMCSWSGLHPVSRLASAAGQTLGSRPRNVTSPALQSYYSNNRKKLSSGLHIFYSSALKCCHALTLPMWRTDKSCLCSSLFYFYPG